MKKTFLIFLIVASFFLIIGPVSAEEGGLVHCTLTGPDRCTFCDIFVVFQTWYTGMMTVVIPVIASFMIVVAGIYYMFSQGQPEKLATARKVLTSIAIGLFLAYGAWLLIEMFLMTVGVVEWTGLTNGGWTTINCESPAKPSSFQSPSSPSSPSPSPPSSGSTSPSSFPPPIPIPYDHTPKLDGILDRDNIIRKFEVGAVFDSYSEWQKDEDRQLILKEMMNEDKYLLTNNTNDIDWNSLESLKYYSQRIKHGAPRPSAQTEYLKSDGKTMGSLPAAVNPATQLFDHGLQMRAKQLAVLSGLQADAIKNSKFTARGLVPYGSVEIDGQSTKISPDYYTLAEAEKLLSWDKTDQFLSNEDRNFLEQKYEGQGAL